ncbi:MAG TPA: hopanoid-associated sugar epimerase [Gammaproteobacteria bacterium]|nr:hopanoid-associated sugar epimerase [Gammaproteobacteria bacterium]
MKTLITGATGFVGSAVLRALLGADREVRALVRSGSDRRNLQGLEVEICTGDLMDAASLKQAVAGCDSLYHVAADYRLWIPDPETMYRINVEGTRNLLLFAAEAGAERIVYTSSVAALGLTTDGSPADEHTPVHPGDKIGHYKKSKYQAEQAVLGMVRDQGLPVVIVNPSTPIGPRDIKPTPTGRIILDTLNGRMPAYVDTGLNIAHVDDVAAGHLLAFEKGSAGERYILGGEDMTLREILAVTCGVAGLRPPRIRLPHNAVLPIAWVMERWAGITGREPMATVDAVRMSKRNMYYSSRKAREKLGYRSRSAARAIEDAVYWFADNGYCRRLPGLKNRG